jgi:nicotinamide mononucleotide adenylyltransferase
MCHEATADSDFIMVDVWEVEQQQYTRTLHVLDHIEKRLCQLFNPPASSATSSSTSTLSNKEESAGKGTVAEVSSLPRGCPPIPLQPRTMLVCGADVVESMADASLWKQDLLATLLKNHGVVCITRDGAGANAAWLLNQPGTLLYQYRDNVILVQDPVPNEISSSAVRRELKEGRSVKYLIAPAVEEYIRQHGLYGTGSKKV